MPTTTLTLTAHRARLYVLLVVLGLVAASYAVFAPARPAVLIALAGAAALGLTAPAMAIAMTVGVAPIIDGLVALLYGIQPYQFQSLGLALIEPVFLGTTAGIVMRHLWRREAPGGSQRPEGRLYVLGMLCVLAVGLAPYVSDWRSRTGYVLLPMWRALPGLTMGAPEHLLRDGLLLLAAPLWLFAVTTSVRTEVHLRQTRLAWLGGAMVAALYGQWMWIHGQGAVAPRVASALDDVNSYGSYLVLSLFMAVTVLADDRRWGARLLASLSIAATTWMLILAGSRIAFLAALGGGIAMAILAVPRRRWIVAAAAVVLTFTTVAGVWVLTPATEGNTPLGLVRNSTDPERVASYFALTRQAIWSATTRAFLGHPLTGIGPGRLYVTLGDYYLPDDPGLRPPNEHAHNYFLQLAAETGAVGLIVFTWLLAAVLLPALRDPTGGLAGRRVLAIAALGYLATCVSGHALILSRQVVLFWSFLGLLAVSSPAAEATRPFAAHAMRWSSWGLVPIALVAVLLGPPSRPCPAGAAGIGVAYGLGFYAAESTATETWRWMRDTGEMRLCNSTGSTVSVDITVPAASFGRPRAVDAYVGARHLAHYAVGEATQTQVILPAISLPPGWTTVGILAAPGSLRVDPILHNGDQRTISIRVGSPSIALTPAR